MTRVVNAQTDPLTSDRGSSIRSSLKKCRFASKTSILSITLVMTRAPQNDLISHGSRTWVTQAGYESYRMTHYLLFTYMTYVFRWWCARFFGL